MKKLLGVIFTLMIVSLAFYYHYNQRLDLGEISEVKTQNVKTIKVINTVQKAPSVTVKKHDDIKEILEYLNSVEYKRTFFIIKPLGSQYTLSYEDPSNHKSCAITFIGGDLVSIDEQYYYTDKYLNRKLITYLTLKGLTKKMDNYYANDIQKGINEVMRKYQVDNHKIVSIKPDIAENNQGPLYFVKVKGNFKKGKQKATFLSFSMLTEKNHIWGISALDNKGKLIWKEM